MKHLTETQFRDKLSQLRTLLKKSAQSKADLKQNIIWADEASKDYTPEYIRENITPKLEQMKVNNKVLNNQIYADVCANLREIETLAEQNQVGLDLSRPEWTNALHLIEMAGSNISGDLVRQINASFANDQPALKALQQIYREKGIKYDGGLDKQISSPGRQYEYLRDFAFTSLVQEVSLNSFAAAIQRVIKLEGEGFEFPGITGSAMVEAARRGAGLPEQPETPPETE